jgi:hypothetical protein
MVVPMVGVARARTLATGLMAGMARHGTCAHASSKSDGRRGARVSARWRLD